MDDHIYLEQEEREELRKCTLLLEEATEQRLMHKAQAPQVPPYGDSVSVPSHQSF